LNGPEIETSRLRLRPVTMDDLDVLHAIWSDPDVARYLWDGAEVSRELAATVLSSLVRTFRDRDLPNWTAIRAGEPAGYCGLRPLEGTEEIEVVYSIARPFWGRGLATEAVRATLRYAFEEWELERVVGVANVENVASRRVLEKLGMRHERTARYQGELEAWYAVSREEFSPGGEVYLLRR
jgi:RimJ/RimL family protein N-acetyltransferase